MDQGVLEAPSLLQGSSAGSYVPPRPPSVPVQSFVVQADPADEVPAHVIACRMDRRVMFFSGAQTDRRCGMPFLAFVLDMAVGRRGNQVNGPEQPGFPTHPTKGWNAPPPLHEGRRRSTRLGPLLSAPKEASRHHLIPPLIPFFLLRFFAIWFSI